MRVRGRVRGHLHGNTVRGISERRALHVGPRTPTVNITTVYEWLTHGLLLRHSRKAHASKQAALTC